MGRHSDITNLCIDILNYYEIFGDTEFQLSTNERIDLVGYGMHENEPVIGIEVEITSHLQHDASKLASLSSLKLRIVISENKDTLSLGSEISTKGKTIYVFAPPDINNSFEMKIREFTGQTDKKWFNVFLREIKVIVIKDPLTDLKREIEEQGLDIETAKDIIFKSALGGVEVGYYKNTKKFPVTEFLKTSDLPREILYLAARHIITELRLGENYESGKYSVYSIMKEANDIALAVFDERVRNRKGSMDEIIRKYGKNAVFISLLGNMGLFTEYNDVIYQIDGGYIAVTLDQRQIPRDLVEEFNIDYNIFNLAHIMVNTPLFRTLNKEIYESFAANNLGNISKYFTSRGIPQGSQYKVPLRNLLRVVDIRSQLDSLDRKALMTYCEWAIFRSHNPSVPQTLYDPFVSIGSNINTLRDMVDETFKAGVTSKLLRDQSNTIAIYNTKEFNDFCEMKMEKLLPTILENDDE